MSDSFLKHIAIAQMQVVPGAPETNLATALGLLACARKAGARLVVFPELCLSGYLIGDLWEEESFVSHCMQCGQDLVAASRGIAVAFGNVGLVKNQIGEDGRPRLYNAAWLAVDGKLQDCPRTGLPFFPKSLLPNYREFEETRHFYDLRRLALERGVPWESLLGPVSIPWGSDNLCVGLTLCEDGWSADYAQDPSAHLVKQGAQVLLNLSASPYTRGKSNKRHRVFHAQTQKFRIPILYANCTGVQNNGKTFFGFDGASTLYHEGILSAPAFAQGLLIDSHWYPIQDAALVTSETALSGNLLPRQLAPDPPALSFPHTGIPFIPDDFVCLCAVVRDYLEKAGLRRVVIGVSGGIDSAVAAALFAHIIGAENLLAVNLPGAYSTGTTRSLAAQLATALGCWYAEVPIGPSVDLTQRQVHGLPLRRSGHGELAEVQHLELSAFALENVQARDRSSRLLAALAAAFGGVFTCNANKAEATVGYSTLYGDHGGFLAPLADLWKEEVYALGHYLNERIYKCEVIPRGIFDIKPTAELSAAQNPEEGGGDPLIYWYHDRLFHAFVQKWNRQGPEDLLLAYIGGSLETELYLPHPVASAFPTAQAWVADLEKWWGLFKGMGVVKRVQAPPVVALSRRAFGFDYRESILSPHWSREYLRLRAQILG